ncbi:hypothetical protein [Desulfurobacterium sp. TC5-1]|uniref:hypothetical protein n=1 Tax=Desulfurobacterium sp. TC5-1 TaxID=1158318 RepID=UPI0003B5D574|nr:hypothetical protein [Desulfurobacterium sp. TC5-1]
MGFLDLFKNITEEEELDELTGLPKHLVEREEEAFIKRKLYEEGKLPEEEKKTDRKESRICYECGFPYDCDIENSRKKRSFSTRNNFDDDLFDSIKRTFDELSGMWMGPCNLDD